MYLVFEDIKINVQLFLGYQVQNEAVSTSVIKYLMPGT